MVTFEEFSDLVKNRRAVYPQFYQPGEIDPKLIKAMLENATWAPTHKKTEPWRFVVITGKARSRFSEFLQTFYKKTASPETFSEEKRKKAGEKPLQSAAVIAICIKRSPETLIPAWEETAALACAVQNLWLSCSVLNIGSYWSTPSAIKDFNDFYPLDETTECLGYFFMGWKKPELQFNSSRKPVEDVTSWVDA